MVHRQVIIEKEKSKQRIVMKVNIVKNYQKRSHTFSSISFETVKSKLLKDSEKRYLKSEKRCGKNYCSCDRVCQFSAL